MNSNHEKKTSKAPSLTKSLDTGAYQDKETPSSGKKKEPSTALLSFEKVPVVSLSLESVPVTIDLTDAAFLHYQKLAVQISFYLINNFPSNESNKETLNEIHAECGSLFKEYPEATYLHRFQEFIQTLISSKQMDELEQLNAIFLTEVLAKLLSSALNQFPVNFAESHELLWTYYCQLNYRLNYRLKNSKPTEAFKDQYESIGFVKNIKPEDNVGFIHIFSLIENWPIYFPLFAQLRSNEEPSTQAFLDKIDFLKIFIAQTNYPTVNYWIADLYYQAAIFPTPEISINKEREYLENALNMLNVVLPKNGVSQESTKLRFNCYYTLAKTYSNVPPLTQDLQIENHFSHHQLFQKYYEAAFGMLESVNNHAESLYRLANLAYFKGKGAGKNTSSSMIATDMRRALSYLIEAEAKAEQFLNPNDFLSKIAFKRYQCLEILASSLSDPNEIINYYEEMLRILEKITVKVPLNHYVDCYIRLTHLHLKAGHNQEADQYDKLMISTIKKLMKIPHANRLSNDQQRLLIRIAKQYQLRGEKTTNTETALRCSNNVLAIIDFFDKDDPRLEELRKNMKRPNPIILDSASSHATKQSNCNTSHLHPHDNQITLISATPYVKNSQRTPQKPPQKTPASPHSRQDSQQLSTQKKQASIQQSLGQSPKSYLHRPATSFFDLSKMLSPRTTLELNPPSTFSCTPSKLISHDNKSVTLNNEKTADFNHIKTTPLRVKIDRRLSYQRESIASPNESGISKMLFSQNTSYQEVTSPSALNRRLSQQPITSPKSSFRTPKTLLSQNTSYQSPYTTTSFSVTTPKNHEKNGVKPWVPAGKSVKTNKDSSPLKSPLRFFQELNPTSLQQEITPLYKINPIKKKVRPNETDPNATFDQITPYRRK